MSDSEEELIFGFIEQNEQAVADTLLNFQIPDDPDDDDTNAEIPLGSYYDENYSYETEPPAKRDYEFNERLILQKYDKLSERKFRRLFR